MMEQVTLQHALEPASDPAWVLTTDGYDELREESLESRFAISNGFLGVKGGRATTRGARLCVPACTYVAGLFDSSGAENALIRLIPGPDWQNIRILLPGGLLVQHPADVASHQMTLDLKRGLLFSQYTHLRTPELKISLHAMRFVSLSERALGMQIFQMEIEEGAVEVTLEASSEGLNLGLTAAHIDQTLGVWGTQHSCKRLAMATELKLQIDGRDLPSSPLGHLKSSWTWKTQPGQVLSFERMVAFVRSDAGGPDPGIKAKAKLDLARAAGWRGVIAAHEAVWADRWAHSEVEVEGDAAARQALRFAVYQLNSAANPDDDQVSIGARALTGEDYHGHVFWDTEIFLLPFYSFTWPKAARALLMYRFHTLEGAREKAAGMGWRGALYAWESAMSGAEMTPAQVVGPDRKIIPILCGKQEQHISADVAYAVWQYWQATGDDGFLCEAGAEIILETSRFWSSRAKLEADGRSHIRGVIGPDEYHENIDDNAYTNVMARWNIRRGLEAAKILRERWPDCWKSLSSKLGLDAAELKQWQTSAETLVTGFDPKTGLFEECAGYFGLETIDLKDYSGRSVPMDVVLGRERIQKSQVVKQADVVALLALLPEEFPGETAAANFQFYEPRCAHGSSLSAAMHGLAAARLGLSGMALHYFQKSAAIDLSDSHVAIGGGLHIAALGGNWMLAVFGFAGLTLRDDGIALKPQLPASWQSLSFAGNWRSRSLKIRIDQDKQRLDATLEVGAPMMLTVGGAPRELTLGTALQVRLSAELGRGDNLRIERNS